MSDLRKNVSKKLYGLGEWHMKYGIMRQKKSGIPSSWGWVCFVVAMAAMLTGCISEGKSSVNSDFSKKPGQEVAYIHSHPVGTTVRYDLNGDGTGENITVDTREYEAGKLTVGSASVEIWSESPTGYFTVLNADTSRSSLLIGISDYGPSDDPVTVLYAYDGEHITEIGYISDIIGQNVYDYDGAVCHGDGTITAKRRWDVLGSWNTVGLYEVDETGIEDITDFYPYMDWEGNQTSWEVTAKVDILAYDLDQSADAVVTVPAGSRMRMTGLRKADPETGFWVAFDVDAVGKTLWVTVERIDWSCYVHTGIGFVSSEEAFDGFYYAG